MKMLEDYYNYYGLEYDNSGHEMRRKTVYLILGYACDLKCRYCFHTNHLSKAMPGEISPQMLHFLKDRLPKSNDKVNIQFWGGEPLLYFDTIKALVLQLKGINSYTFQIVTNGTQLTQAIVDFCNNNRIIMGISHDGVLNLLNRGYDPIEDKYALINQIQYFSGFSSVFTPQNDSFYAIYNYFLMHPLLDADKRRTRIYPVVDVGLSDDVSLFSERLQEEMQIVVNNLLQNIAGGNLRCFELDMVRANAASYFMAKKYPQIYNELFNSLLLNIDVQGNVYYDSGGNFLIGTVDAPLEEIKTSFINAHYRHYNRWDKCLKCKVKPICNGGQLLGTKESKNFCNMYLKYFTPIIKLLEA